ncbi:hypothetical protein [Polyangium fumosum]|uniref:Glycosyltransferase RgtA/B/C/D-like domain-containing protein n=1 Tax=Polyangium fumosum TaxID=889272 RepID=A0A4U1IAS3_9BACT|nr:hypothetical protein [Polyangium fumosum]TKC90557.1 hypothetical protein E8A74_50945 [Polyangium fumosum]
MLTRVKGWLADRRAPLLVALLAILLLLPTLGAGAMMDDHAHRMAYHPTFTRPGGPRGDWDLFRFLEDDPVAFRSLQESGIWPWWAVAGSKLAFLRPLPSLWHALDYRVWPNAYWFMHAESILVFAATAFFAAHLYRRLFGATVAAGLAALIFAVDDTHAMVVAWIANRHAILSTLFAVLTLLAHDRARRDGWKPGVYLAPLALFGAMFSGESGLGALAYLFAYALFLDRAPLRARAAALVPHAGVALLWFAAYKLGKYGAAGGVFYIDPLTQTGEYLHAVATRLPVLLAGQMAAPPADVWMLWPQSETRTLVSICLLVLLALGGGIFAVLRRDRNAGFFTVGMTLSLLPTCAVWPGDRLLLFAGIGGSGLVASMLVASREHLGRAARVYVGAVAGVLVLFHLVLAPLLLPLRAWSTGEMLHGYTERAITSMPKFDATAPQTLVVVSSPDSIIANTAIAARINANEAMPSPLRVLSTVQRGTLKVGRVDARTLSVTLSDGHFMEPTATVFRDPEKAPLRVGDRVDVGSMVAEVVTLTPDGKLPAQIDFHFDRSLEDPSMVWVVWEKTRFVPFEVPKVGETRELPVVPYQTAMGG